MVYGQTHGCNRCYYYYLAILAFIHSFINICEEFAVVCEFLVNMINNHQKLSITLRLLLIFIRYLLDYYTYH